MKISKAYFNSNDGTGLLFWGEKDRFIWSETTTWEDLQSFLDKWRGDYIAVALSYDLKNEIENLSSQNKDDIHFPQALFFVPEEVVSTSGQGNQWIYGRSSEECLSFLEQLKEKKENKLPDRFKPLISKSTYIQHVKELKEEIQFGNIYEVNFCQEYFVENIDIEDTLACYHRLNKITKAPYSVFWEWGDFSIWCGSPESFIEKKGNLLTSSPIKGTRKRGETKEEDEYLIKELLEDPKERSENVMIVDLVRNDFSRIAQRGTVKVDELMKIYTFETVHQMVSMISCRIREDVHFSDIVKAVFPPGSMTGAPKISAMKLIEKHESFRRGIYSGSIGYIMPNGDFKMNVIIRTLVYNKKQKYLSCGVGGAITINADPEQEYQECKVKIGKILRGIND